MIGTNIVMQNLKQTSMRQHLSISYPASKTLSKSSHNILYIELRSSLFPTLKEKSKTYLLLNIVTKRFLDINLQFPLPAHAPY